MPVGFSEILSEKTKPGWYYFKEGSNISPSQIFTTYKPLFGLSANNEMRLIKSTRDDKGFTHAKYKQYYKGLPVEVSMLIVHTRTDNTVSLVNGNIIRNIKLPAEPLINEQAALSTALKAVPASVYLWQDNRFELIKKETEKNEKATYYPKGKLCIYPASRNESLLTQDFSLGWLIDVYVYQGSPSIRVFVDALDGQIKNRYKLGNECASGTATTTFNGSQSISTKLVGSNYTLVNDCQATVIHTYNLLNDSVKSRATEFTDGNNTWNGAATIHTNPFFGRKNLYLL